MGVTYYSLSILEIKVHDGKTKCLKKIYIDISQMEHGRPNRTIISLLYSKMIVRKL